MVNTLNPEDDEGGDGLDFEGFSDVFLLLGFYLKFQECRMHLVKIHSDS